MPATPPRRFTLFEGMVLIAATAVGIACSRAMWLALGISTTWPDTWAAWLEFAAIVFGTTWPILAVWTVAILFLRLLKPRPRWRRLTRQPGLIACLAVTTTLAFLVSVVVGISVVDVIIMGFKRINLSALLNEFAELLIFVTPILIQIGVLCAWTTLAVTGRWRSERSWIDGAGRLIGVAWFVVMMAGTFFVLYQVI